MKIIFINAKEQKVDILNTNDLTIQSPPNSPPRHFRDILECIQHFVEGYIEIGIGPLVRENNKDSDIMYVNEEGRLRDIRYGFRVKNTREEWVTFIGNGVWTGSDGAGNAIDTSVSLTKLKDKVRFFKVIVPSEN